MNTLRTVFAFVVLVCAIAFASAAYVLVQNTNDYSKKWNDEKKAHKEDVDKLTTEKSALTASLATANAEVEKWKGLYDALFLKVGEKDTEITKLNTDLKDAKDLAARQSGDIAEIKATQAKQNDENLRLTKENEAMRQAKIDAEKAQRDAEDALKKAQDDIVNLQKMNELRTGELKSAVELNKRYAEVYGEDGLRLAQAAPAPVPLINGIVKHADNPMRLIAISVGKDDGVKTGMTFEVVRSSSSEYVGRVRVLDVQDTQSICRIDTAMTSDRAIAEGDHVTTRAR